MAVDKTLVDAAIELVQERFGDEPWSGAAAMRLDDGSAITSTPAGPSLRRVQPVRVVTRVGVFDGHSDGEVVHFDGLVFLSDQVVALQRNYLIVSEGVKLTRPARWDDDWRSGAWYVDVVECIVQGSQVVVFDRYIDFIVPASASPYRVLDLDEFGEALSQGAVSLEAAARALRSAQSFVDTYLHRRGQAQGGSWRDFPPASVVPYLQDNRRVSRATVTPPDPPPDDWRSLDV